MEGKGKEKAQNFDIVRNPELTAECVFLSLKFLENVLTNNHNNVVGSSMKDESSNVQEVSNGVLQSFHSVAHACEQRLSHSGLFTSFREMTDSHPNTGWDQLPNLVSAALQSYNPPFSVFSRSLLDSSPYSAAALAKKTVYKPNLESNSLIRKITDRSLFGTETNSLCGMEHLSTSYQHLHTVTGHKSAVYCIKMDHSGTRFFTGSDDFLVKAWELKTGQLLRTLRGHTGEISDLSVSVDDALLASGSNDDTIRLWNLQNYSCLGCISAHKGFSIIGLDFWPSDIPPFQANDDEPRFDADEKGNEREKVVPPKQNRRRTKTRGRKRVFTRSKKKRKAEESDSDYSELPNTVFESQQLHEHQFNEFENETEEFVPIPYTSPRLAHVLFTTDYSGIVFVWDCDKSLSSPVGAFRITCIRPYYIYYNSAYVYSSNMNSHQRFGDDACDAPQRSHFYQRANSSVNRTQAVFGRLHVSETVAYYGAGGKVCTVWEISPGMFLPKYYHTEDQSLSYTDLITKFKNSKLVIKGKPVFQSSSDFELNTFSFAKHTNMFGIEGIYSHLTIVKLPTQQFNDPTILIPECLELTIPNVQLDLKKKKRYRILDGFFGPHDLYFVSSSYDKVIRLWSAENGQLIRSFAEHSKRSLALLQLGIPFITSDQSTRQYFKLSHENESKLNDNEVFIIEETHDNTNSNFVRSSDGDEIITFSTINPNSSCQNPELFYFVSAGLDGKIVLWCSGFTQPLFVLHKRPCEGVRDLEFTEGAINCDGSKMVFATKQQHVVIVGSGNKGDYSCPCEQFFPRDYQVCIMDNEGTVIDGIEQVEPHTLPNGPLQNSHSEPYENIDSTQISLENLTYKTFCGYAFIPHTMDEIHQYKSFSVPTRAHGQIIMRDNRPNVVTVPLNSSESSDGDYDEDDEENFSESVNVSSSDQSSDSDAINTGFESTRTPSERNLPRLQTLRPNRRTQEETDESIQRRTYFTRSMSSVPNLIPINQQPIEIEQELPRTSPTQPRRYSTRSSSMTTALVEERNPIFNNESNLRPSTPSPPKQTTPTKSNTSTTRKRHREDTDDSFNVSNEQISGSSELSDSDSDYPQSSPEQNSVSQPQPRVSRDTRLRQRSTRNSASLPPTQTHLPNTRRRKRAE